MIGRPSSGWLLRTALLAPFVVLLVVGGRAWSAESEQLELEGARAARTEAAQIAVAVERAVMGGDAGLRAGAGAPALPVHAVDLGRAVARDVEAFDARLRRDGAVAAEAWLAELEAAPGWAELRRAALLEARGEASEALAIRTRLAALASGDRDARGVRIDLAARALLVLGGAPGGDAAALLEALDADWRYPDEWGTAALFSRVSELVGGAADWGSRSGDARAWRGLRRGGLDARVVEEPVWVQDGRGERWIVVADGGEVRGLSADAVAGAAFAGEVAVELGALGLGAAVLDDEEREICRASPAPPAAQREATANGVLYASVPLMVGSSRLGSVVTFELEPGSATARLRARRRAWLLVLGVALLATLVAALVGFRALRRQEQLNRDREGFVAAVSHELKTPLTATRLLGELLERGDLDEAKVREFGGRIARESERLDQLVRGVLDLSRLERIGLDRGRASSTAPRDLFDAAMERSAASVREAGVEVECVESDDAQQCVLVDADSLVGALVNLVENAVRHAPGASPIELAAVAQGQRLRLEVRDRGPGVPAAERKRIFGEFQRGGDEDTRKTQGAGIGLALVSRIAAAHDGRAFVEPRVGGGSVFVIEVPRDRRKELA